MTRRAPALAPLVATVLLALAPGPAAAESLVAAATIRSQTVLTPEHLMRSPDIIPGALTEPADALGLETQVTIYPGRAIRAADLGPPALVDRNQIVRLIFKHGSLSIETEGRVLDRAPAGARVRVLNLASRSTVFGTVTDAGFIVVGDGLP